MLNLKHHPSSNLAVHEVIGAPSIDEDSDGLLLEETSNLYRLLVRVAGKSINHTIGRLYIFLHVVLLVLEVLLFPFRFISGFNQEKSYLLASVVAAPRLIAMPTQPLRGSVVKLFSCKFLRLRGSVGSGWG
ncbi:hypothetical protein GW17_00025485 [Ensete ventricosum]|nr:hypothetical protein GW17_00025485 [Ensete ventricosum]RZS10008.1 hypothetical protein BHM03_00041145 [Ensete ventricosum]